jgi:hypothetical protein
MLRRVAEQPIAIDTRDRLSEFTPGSRKERNRESIAEAR